MSQSRLSYGLLISRNNGRGENFCGGIELELSHPHESLCKTTVSNQATEIKFKGSTHITHSLLDAEHMIVSFVFFFFCAQLK